MNRTDIDNLAVKLGIDLAVIAGRGLPFHAEADELVSIGMDILDREQWLAPAAAAAWRQMQAAAAADALQLLPVSGYRSIAQQRAIIERKLASGMTISAILVGSAPPGYSEHHTGYALDIAADDSSPLSESFAQTAAFAWLTKNAGRFGYALSYPRGNRFGFCFEPWHWCFRAADNADEPMQENDPG